MSTMQRISLIGLYDYDPTIFDRLTLPEGYDKPTFINNLLLEHGEKCVLYTDPDFMKNAIGMWSGKWALELSRIYEALTAEYNPIYNYDRYEHIEDERTKDRTDELEATHNATTTADFNEDQTNDYDITVTQETDGTVEHQVSADNSDNYQPDYRDISNNGQTVTNNDGTIKRNTKGTMSDLEEGNNSTLTGNETEGFTHEGHLYGNIGVTTSAQMVTEVIKQRFQYNLYGIACRIFATELLIGIY